MFLKFAQFIFHCQFENNFFFGGSAAEKWNIQIMFAFFLQFSEIFLQHILCVANGDCTVWAITFMGFVHNAWMWMDVIKMIYIYFTEIFKLFITFHTQHTPKKQCGRNGLLFLAIKNE